jgi:hypothetical protein
MHHATIKNIDVAVPTQDLYDLTPRTTDSSGRYSGPDTFELHVGIIDRYAGYVFHFSASADSALSGGVFLVHSFSCAGSRFRWYIYDIRGVQRLCPANPLGDDTYARDQFLLELLAGSPSIFEVLRYFRRDLRS